MSLINDALKKAQTMQARGPGSAPSFPRPDAPAGEDASTAAEPARVSLLAKVNEQVVPLRAQSSKRGLMLAAVGGTLLLGVGAFGLSALGVFGGASDAVSVAEVVPPQPAAPVSAPAPVAPVAPVAVITPPPAPAPEPAEVVPEPVAPAISFTPPPAPEPVETAPVIPEPAPAPVTTVVEPAPVVTEISDPVEPAPVPVTASVPEAAPAPVVEPVAPVVVTAPVAPPPPRPDPAIQAWVAKIQVTGFRSGVKPRVLMNDRVYAVGETVNYDFELLLSRIGDHVLEFKDQAGNIYSCRF